MVEEVAPRPSRNQRTSVLRVPGMPALVAVSLTAFSGYAALLATAPAYAVSGGATEAGAGLVNGVLLAATVATQLCVPWLLRRFGTGPVLAASMVLMGLPALGYAVSDALVPVLAWSAVRGTGFGIVTVVGSTVVAHLVSPSRRGEAVGVYGLAVAAPMIVLMPAGVAVAESLGYGWVFAIAALPLVGFPWALSLGRRVDRTPPASVSAGAEVEAHITDRDTVRLVLRPTVVLFAVTMAGGALMTFAPQLGLGGGWAAAALFAMSLASALARWRVGLLADRHGAGALRRPAAAACRCRPGRLRPRHHPRPGLAAAAGRAGAGAAVRRAAEPHPAHRLRPGAAGRHSHGQCGVEPRLRLRHRHRLGGRGGAGSGAVVRLGLLGDGRRRARRAAAGPAPRPVAGGDVAVRVLTLNLRLDLDRWPERLPLVVGLIASARADVVALQEVALTIGQDRLLAEALRELGPAYVVHTAQKWGDQERAEGVSLLTRLPARDHEVLRLPGDGGRVAQRVALRLRDGQDVTVANTHLHHLPLEDESVREPQARAILDWLGDPEGACSSAT